MTEVATTAPPLTALVTGATSGLGKEIAMLLARDGMRVVVVGRIDTYKREIDTTDDFAVGLGARIGVDNQHRIGA